MTTCTPSPAASLGAFWRTACLLLLFWGGLSSSGIAQFLSISGPATVCPGSTVTYEVVSDSGFSPPFENYQWFLFTGGTIVGPSDETTVTVAWDASQAGSEHTLVIDNFPFDFATLDITQSSTANGGAGMACKTNVQVSIDATGSNEITPDILLQGSLPDYSGYAVSIEDASGNDLGNTVNCSHIGQALIGKVTDLCSGNSCWGEFTVEDKQAPVIDCPTVKTLTCNSDPNLLPPPAATDNCSVPTLTLVAQTLDNDDICGNGVVITRTWIATDEFGNTSAPCTEEIRLESPALPTFPEDVVWTCEQFAAYPNITEAEALNAAITDTDLTTTPVDAATTLAPAVLTNTGSGTVSGATGAYCAFSTSFSDDIVEICGGSFKILRDWTVFNWCTNTVITTGALGRTNLQVIKVLDTTAPSLVVTPITAEVNIDGTHPNGCRSTGALPLPFMTDNCGTTSLRVFTPIGEADYTNGVDATDGASIPAPGLEMGVYSLIYKLTDDCGNLTETTGALIVEDVMPPVAVCDAITEITLNNLGEAVLPAAVLDDGSSDNCGIDRFEVKRMGASDATFAESILFTCADPDQMVVLRVYDVAGNFNECMVEVLVEDKLLPTCEAPESTSISCIEFRLIDPTDLTALADRFGTATAADNCGVTVVELPAQVSLDQCGAGTVTRRFTSIDNHGNTVNCTQLITVFQDSDYTINFPADAEVLCGDDVNAPELTYSNFGCDLLAVEMTDELFEVGNNGNCNKIVRTWEVINWCVPNGLDVNIGHDPAGRTVLSSTYSTGVRKYTYQQIIKINDDVAPEVSFVGDTEFCSLSTTDCGSAAVNLPLSVSDACSADIQLEWTLDAFTDGDTDAFGTGTFAGIYPVGTHRLTYIVTDACGNATEEVIDFAVSDCIKPVAYCQDGLVVGIMQTGMVTVWAVDFDAGSYDNCSDELTFSFSADPADDQRTFECGDLGFINLKMYITDAAGNQDFCDVIMELQDNNGACPAPTNATIRGQLQTQTAQAVAEVQLEVSNYPAVMTDADGIYELVDIQQGSDITVVPTKVDEVRVGVTTYDLVLISKHILGTQPFDSPYQYLAADANNSETVSTLDIVALRKLILFINDTLPQNDPWRFVAADYTFPEVQNPWAEAFPELVNINNVSGEHANIDFTAIKIGDINSSYHQALAGSAAEDRNGVATVLEIRDQRFEAGETVRVPVRLPAATEGLQFDLQYAAELTLDHIEYGTATAAHINAGADHVLVSWNGEQPADELFTMVFKATATGTLVDAFTLSERHFAAESYPVAGGVRDLQLAFVPSDATALQLDNYPNPFYETTTLRFVLPTAGTATLRLVDATGRTVHTQTTEYTAGEHTYRLRATDLTGPGVYRVLLATENQQLQHTFTQFER